MERGSITSSAWFVGAVFVACLSLQQCDYPALQAPTSPSRSPIAPVVASPYVGYVAPDFAVKSVNGETIKLNDLRGKVVLLAFFGISS